MKSLRSWYSRLMTLLLFAASYGQTAAKDLFQVTAITTDLGPTLRASDRASSMLPPVQVAIKVQGPFSAFAPRGWSRGMGKVSSGYERFIPDGGQ